MRIEPVIGRVWAIVAAAARNETGPDRASPSPEVVAPAQYGASPDSPASPLQNALHRAAAIAPRQRIVTVVAAEHRVWWQGPLWFLPRSNVITQPESRGSAVGILLALQKILERDRDAKVVVLPATHQVRDEEILMAWIRRAATLAALRPKRLFVLGIDREAGVAARAYVVIGRYDNRGGFETARLLETPSSFPTEKPSERRMLWNSGIVAGAAAALLQVFKRRVPDLILHGEAVTHGAARGEEYSAGVSRIRERLSGIDFFRHVLQGQESHVRVLPVPRCGWSDLSVVGSGDGPQRVDDDVPTPHGLLRRLGDIAWRQPALKREPLAPTRD